MFNEQHGEIWSSIEQHIFEMFREIFHCATIEEPPFSIGSCLSSQALYAADLILESKHNNKIQPKLLEINFAPDCQHAYILLIRLFIIKFLMFFFEAWLIMRILYIILMSSI